MPRRPASGSNPDVSSPARSGVTADSAPHNRTLSREGARGALPFRSGWDGLAVGLLALVTYAFFAPAASGYGDCSELALVLATGGVAHPTGYPIYVLGGHLFVRTLHSFGIDWAHAANLWSAVGAAVALALLQILARELARGPGRSGPRLTATYAALASTFVLAINPIWTAEALLAEVYSWHLAWVMAATLVFVSALRRILGPRPPAPTAVRAGAALWGALIGLGLAHHLTSLLVSLPLTLMLLWAALRQRLLSGGLVLRVGLGMLPPLATYGIVAWRAWHPASVQWPLLAPSPLSLLEHLTGAQYQHFLGRFAPSELHAALLADAGYPLLICGIAALFFGAVRGARPAGERLLYGGLLGASLLITLGGFRYGVPDPSSYFLPALALGVAATAPILASVGERLLSTRPRQFAAGALVLAALVSLALHWGPQLRARSQEARDVERLSRTLWAAVPDQEAIVFWPDDAYTRLRQYQLLRGEKPGLFVTAPSLLVSPWPRSEFARRFGFDPLEGLEVPRLTPGQVGERAAIDRFHVEVVRNVTERGALPVILVDPTVPNVRQLRRSAASPRAGGAGDTMPGFLPRPR